jgi:hypothetical protein
MATKTLPHGLPFNGDGVKVPHERARFSSRPLSLLKMTLPRMEEAFTASFQTVSPFPSSSAACTKR